MLGNRGYINNSLRACAKCEYNSLRCRINASFSAKVKITPELFSAFLKEMSSEPLVCQRTIESITESSELLPLHHIFGSNIVTDEVTYIVASG